uniref:Uncharacterized protein n=1 Tax=Arundo donax TaxID=35708 RepID=A0A0A8YB65_ARUDO
MCSQSSSHTTLSMALQQPPYCYLSSLLLMVTAFSLVICHAVMALDVILICSLAI